MSGDVSISGNKVIIKSFRCLEQSWLYISLPVLHFSYTGAAPDAFFYVGTRGRPESAGSDGVRIQYPAGSESPLARYSDQDVEFSLPEGLEGKNVTWVSVWCRAYTINFGHAWLTDDIPSGAPTSTPTCLLVLSIFLLPVIAITRS